MALRVIGSDSLPSSPQTVAPIQRRGELDVDIGTPQGIDNANARVSQAFETQLRNNEARAQEVSALAQRSGMSRTGQELAQIGQTLADGFNLYNEVQARKLREQEVERQNQAKEQNALIQQQIAQDKAKREQLESVETEQARKLLHEGIMEMHRRVGTSAHEEGLVATRRQVDAVLNSFENLSPDARRKLRDFAYGAITDVIKSDSSRTREELQQLRDSVQDTNISKLLYNLDGYFVGIRSTQDPNKRQEIINNAWQEFTTGTEEWDFQDKAFAYEKFVESIRDASVGVQRESAAWQQRAENVVSFSEKAAEIQRRYDSGDITLNQRNLEMSAVAESVGIPSLAGKVVSQIDIMEDTLRRQRVVDSLEQMAQSRQNSITMEQYGEVQAVETSSLAFQYVNNPTRLLQAKQLAQSSGNRASPLLALSVSLAESYIEDNRRYNTLNKELAKHNLTLARILPDVDPSVLGSPQVLDALGEMLKTIDIPAEGLRPDLTPEALEAAQNLSNSVLPEMLALRDKWRNSFLNVENPSDKTMLERAVAGVQALKEEGENNVGNTQQTTNEPFPSFSSGSNNVTYMPRVAPLARINGRVAPFRRSSGNVEVSMDYGVPVAGGGTHTGIDYRVSPATTTNVVASRLVNEANKWVNREFKRGQTARCADFVRSVLRDIGVRLPVTKQPEDAGRQTYNGELMARSFFGGDVGRVFYDLEEAQPGDIVGFRNTYGNFGEGAITHVGIYVGNGQIIDRSTSAKPVRKRSVNTFGQGNYLFVRPNEFETEESVVEPVNVSSISGGIVQSVKPFGVYGNTILVSTPSGAMEQYSHLSSLNVKVGEQIAPGQAIAVVDPRQNPNAQLHFQVWAQNILDYPELAKDPQANTLNPNDYLATINGTNLAPYGVGSPPRQGVPGSASQRQNVSPHFGTYGEPYAFTTPSGHTLTVPELFQNPNIGFLRSVQERRGSSNTQQQRATVVRTQERSSVGAPLPNNRASIHKRDYGTNDPDANYGYATLRDDVVFARMTANIANDLGIPAQWLVDVMAFETGGTFNPKITNSEGAVGLIQFYPGGGQALVGKTGAQLRNMSRTEQLQYVKLYLEKTLQQTKNNRGIQSIEDLLALVWGGASLYDKTPTQRRNVRDSNTNFYGYITRLGSHAGRRYHSSYDTGNTSYHTTARNGCPICASMLRKSGRVFPHTEPG